MSIGNILFAILAFLFGLYEIGYGFYAYHLNGFKFYITAGSLIGLPFLVISAYLILHHNQQPIGWEPLIFVVWLIGVGWKAWRTHVTRRTHPNEWENWERIMASWKRTEQK
jgi:hypothetical protein